MKVIEAIAGNTLYQIFKTSIPTILIDPTARREFEDQIRELVNKLIDNEKLALELKETIKEKHGQDIAGQIRREILFTPIPHPSLGRAESITATGSLARSINVLDNDEAETPSCFVIGAEDREENFRSGNPALYGSVLETGGYLQRDPDIFDSQMNLWLDIRGIEDPSDRFFIKRAVAKEGVEPRGWWSFIIENYELPEAVDKTIEEFLIKLISES